MAAKNPRLAALLMTAAAGQTDVPRGTDTRIAKALGLSPHAVWAARKKMGLGMRSTTDVDEPVNKLPNTPDAIQEMAVGFLAEHAALPPVPEHIKTTRLEDMGFSTPQSAVALFSDLHYGSRIDRRATAGLAEYNIDIAVERLTRWRDRLLRFTQVSQLVYDVDVLHLLALGDDLEGHGAMFPTQALQMEESIYFQVLGFVEIMSGILLDMLVRYKKLRIYKVHGNHGRGGRSAKESYGPDNWELLAWRMIADRVRVQTGGSWTTTANGIDVLTGGQIDFFISPSFIMFLEIEGWNVAVRHGHGIRGIQSTYTGALDNKFRLNAVLGEVINYYLKAHLHEAQSTESEIRGEVIQNGCFVGPSLLSLEMSRAAANLPSQEFMLFHPKHGKTHAYRLHLADPSEIRQHEWVGRA